MESASAIMNQIGNLSPMPGQVGVSSMCLTTVGEVVEGCHGKVEGALALAAAASIDDLDGNTSKSSNSCVGHLSANGIEVRVILSRGSGKTVE